MSDLSKEKGNIVLHKLKVCSAFDKQNLKNENSAENYNADIYQYENSITYTTC